MTMESWKKEFYPVAADIFIASEIKRTDIELVEHALKKWRGLTPENLRKHGLHRFGSAIFQFTAITTRTVKFFIADTTCTLCLVYLRSGGGCSLCPLYKMRDKPCDSSRGLAQYSPYASWSVGGDPGPMANLLELTLEKLRKEEHDKLLLGAAFFKALK